MLSIEECRDRLTALQAEERLLGQQLDAEIKRLERLQKESTALDKARVILQAAAVNTQNKLKVRLTAIVTTALRSVFADADLDFRVEFVSKRGRTEAVLEVGEDGVYTAPMEGHGGGVVDIVSFALRASFWSIARTREVLIADEPFKFLSPDLRPLAADMLKMVSDRLKLQIIMVTHIPEFVEIADNVITVERQGGNSTVRSER